MKGIYRFIRIAMAAAGFICIFGAAGTDEYYTELRQMPPDSVDTMVAWGLVLLIPQGLHWLRIELRKRIRR